MDFQTWPYTLQEESLLIDLYAAMRDRFGVEWTQLNQTASRRRIVDDFLQAHREDGCTVQEYQSRIGAGNLSSYHNCLRIQEERRVKA